MLAALAFAPLAVAQDPGGDLPVLRVGETTEGEIAGGDPEVHTPTLDKAYTDAPVVGKAYVVEVEEGGPYTIELRSYLFDAYLVLRDEAGEVWAEDDDGGIGVHARIVAELEAGLGYRLESCALHGERGAFELELVKGRPRGLSPGEERAAERADLERTLAIRENVLGPEHPSTATSVEQLALCLETQGDYAAARALYERALVLCEKQLGPEHLVTAAILSHLGIALNAQGDYAAARALYERSLAICEKQFGPEHLDTATCLNNLSGILLAQGDYAAARPCIERALAIRMKQLGPEHPVTS
jgi:tetratricopeptide (TPR) repeat protein